MRQTHTTKQAVKEREEGRSSTKLKSLALTQKYAKTYTKPSSAPLAELLAATGNTSSTKLPRYWGAGER